MTEKLGRFELLGQIAVGGMAEIHIARQKGMEGFEKLVVIKRLLPNLASRNEVVELFLNEARIVAPLSHPNVIQIYDLGKADGSYFIAMEYVQGENLRILLKNCAERKRQLPLPHALTIIKQACEGLHYAHTKTDPRGKPLDIVHCDISPQNILVSFDGVVKVVDFGIARAAATLEQTDPGRIHGKHGYMSPEQCRGKSLDARSDIFSLSVVLFEVCTTRRLFKFKTPLEALKAITSGAVVSPRSLNPQIPESLDEVILRGLNVKPEDRYQTALQMGLAIDREIKSLDQEAGSLHLGTFMRRLFPDKLEKLRQAEEASHRGEFPSGDWYREDEGSSSMSPFDHESKLGLPDRPPSEGAEAQNGTTSTPPPVAASDPDITAPRFRGQPPARLAGGRDSRARAMRLALVAVFGLLGLTALGVFFQPQLQALLGRGEEDKPRPPVVGTAVVISTPAGAMVSLNGAKQCATPCEVSLLEPQAENRLQIFRSGHKVWQETFALRPGERIRTFAVQLQKIPKRYGAVEVNTTPPGAKVEMDGRLQDGITPLTIKSVVAGKRHTVRAWIVPDRVWVTRFSLKPNETKAIYGALPD